jgi:Carboxypeptidase regulatory-like domain
MLPIFWLALWLGGLQVRPAPSSASIQGVVVRAGAAAAAASQQVADARVELKPGNRSVFTDADGAFTFRNVAPGRYTISVTHDGLIPQEDRRRGLTISGLSVTLAADQTLKDIVLPMIPAPVITGKVVDPHGQPLAAALVRAYLRQYTPYGTQLKIVRKGMTNDLGEFRLFGLNFGEYFVSAGYSDRDRAAAIGKAQLSANVSRADDGYATIFYDGAEDISRAQATHLAPAFYSGTLNIYLRDSAQFKVRGQVLPLIDGTKVVFAPKGSDLTEADYFTQPDTNGAFEIPGISPGSYLLFATAANGALSSDVIAVNVTDRDIDGVRLALQETMSISGRLLLEGSLRTNLSALHVKVVRSSTEFDQRIDAVAGPDGAFSLEHIAPFAEYDIAVEPIPLGTYVKSISSAGRDILPGRSRLLPNQPLQVVVATATDGLEVHVTNRNDPAAGVQVVLIPGPLLRRRADRYVTGFTNESGDLQLTVPPGEYTAYAFEQIEPGAYYALAYNPSANSRFTDRAISVTVGQNGTKAIQLRVIPAAETAGGLQ